MGGVASVIMLGGMLVGAVYSGVESGKTQAELKDQFCTNLANLKKYIQLSQQQANILDAQNTQALIQLRQVGAQILQLNYQIKQSKQKFKKFYLLYSIVGTLFIIMLIFVFAVKKFVLA